MPWFTSVFLPSAISSYSKEHFPNLLPSISQEAGDSGSSLFRGQHERDAGKEVHNITLEVKEDRDGQKIAATMTLGTSHTWQGLETKLLQDGDKGDRGKPTQTNLRLPCSYSSHVNMQ